MKRRFLIGIGIMFVVLCIASANPKQKSYTGTTTGSYVKAVDVPTADWEDLFFIVANTGVAQTMYYKAYGYAVYGGTGYEEFVSETSIGTSSNETIKISNTAYANIEIWVKSNSGATTYQIEYILKP